MVCTHNDSFQLTENVLNEVREKEYQTADNQVIQKPDADQSDKSVIHKSDINMVMAEDDNQVKETSSESKEISDKPRTDSVIQEAKPEPEAEQDLKTETECTPLEKKTGGKVCFFTISFIIVLINFVVNNSLLIYYFTCTV